MSNASLKEQLQAVASQLTDKTNPATRSAAPIQPSQPKRKFEVAEKAGKPKPKWLEYAQYGVELLKAYFPEGFREVNDIKPLKVGIKQDLVKRLSTLDAIVTEDKACMVKALSYYVNTAAYHKCMHAGVERIDLDGKPEGLVTAEEAKYSEDRQQAKLLAKQNTKPNPISAHVPEKAG